VRAFVASRTTRMKLEDTELPVFIEDWPRGLRPASMRRCSNGMLLRYDAPAGHAEVFVHRADAQSPEGGEPRIELLAHTVHEEPAQRLVRALQNRFRKDERATAWLATGR